MRLVNAPIHGALQIAIVGRASNVVAVFVNQNPFLQTLNFVKLVPKMPIVVLAVLALNFPMDTVGVLKLASPIIFVPQVISAKRSVVVATALQIN